MNLIKNLKEVKIKPFFKWFDLWVGIYVDVHGGAVYICPLPTLGLKVDYSETRWFQDWYYGDDEDVSEHWLCACGKYVEDGCHCPECLREPPWGCPCSWCQDERYYEPDADSYYPGPWDD